MGNISDYIIWRGDIPLKVKPFNQIDNLILCQLLYAQLDSIVPESLTSKVSLAKASKIYFEKKLHKKNLGVLLNNETANLLKAAGESQRFSNILLCGFENIIDKNSEVQFAAMCALLPTGQLCVVFRGTDDTLIGWKEDFKMSFTYPVPAQELAVKYLEKACIRYKKTTYIMGHSKGGNLAVHAAAFCSQKIGKKIAVIYNNDGPGFFSETCKKIEFRAIEKRIHTVLPESSIVGILLTQPSKPTYIESSEKNGISQHDIFSWKLQGPKIKVAECQNPLSVLTEKTVNTWLAEVGPKDREKFINELFEVLSVTNATTLLELTENWLESSVAVIRTMNKLDKKTKDQIYKIIGLLFHSIHVNLPPLKEFFSRG